MSEEAKNKAIELVYKYEDLVTTWNCYWDTEILIEDRLPDMKKCALIAVDEILYLLEEKIGHDLPKAKMFWQEVKNQIKSI